MTSPTLTPVRGIESYAVIIRAIHERGETQQEALAELARRGLWLTDEQKQQAGLPPRPYHAATLQTYADRATQQTWSGALRDVLPTEWRDPKYPGDSVMIVDLVRGGELGSVRVQAYLNTMREGIGDYKVGTFLPGVTECSPGDTPKTWPERHEYADTRAEAAKVFVQYLIEALRGGWRPAAKAA